MYSLQNVWKYRKNTIHAMYITDSICFGYITLFNSKEWFIPVRNDSYQRTCNRKLFLLHGLLLLHGPIYYRFYNFLKLCFWKVVEPFQLNHGRLDKDSIPWHTVVPVTIQVSLGYCQTRILSPYVVQSWK